MLSHKNKYILYLVILNGLLCSSLIIWGNNIFEFSSSIIGIAIALAIFFIYELFIILLLDCKKITVNPRKSINLLLGLKAVKFFISLLFISIYAIIFKVELKLFIGAFIAIYFIFLFFDMFYLTSREKILKSKKIKEIKN